MEYKKSLIILTILTIFLFGISSAFASDMNDAAIAIEHDMPIESTQDDDIKADEVFTDNPKTFTQLDNEINESQDTFEVKYNYAFNNESDYGPVVIDKSNFTINGNNHILDGNGQSGIFNITGNNITINNLIFINGNSFRGSAIYSAGQTTLNNVTFINNNAYGGAIYSNGQLTLNNATFINNTAQGGAIYTNGQTTLNNVTFINNTATSGGAIYTNGQTTINNATLINNTAHWGGAIYSSGQTTLNNVTFINNTATSGGAINSHGQTTINNVTFINNNAYNGGAISHYDYIINCNNSRFIDNYAEWGSSLYSDEATINICNTFFTSQISNKYGQIQAFSSTVNIDTGDFLNISATYSPAIYFEDCESSITNSRFINLTAYMSAGAIIIKRSGNTYIKGCEFINTKSFKNAGAIIVDYTIEEYGTTILDCVFENTSSMIGGAYIQLGGSLIINDTNFTNNKATYYGGAVYISFADSQITNCIFDSNGVELLDDNPTHGGAIYSDYSYLKISKSKFTNNSAYMGNAIYACDSLYDITNSTFASNTNAIYTDFDFYFDLCNLENNEYNGDTVITNQSFYYPTFVDTPTLNLTLTNNTIIVSELPCRFDLRDWGWVTPIKNQERKGACWTFVLISAVESALLKEYGIELDLSENNMFNYALKYSPYGYLNTVEGGFFALGVSNLVSWCGPVLEELNVYDEVGKLSPPLQVDYDIVHIQDVIRIPNDEVPENSKIKTAILNYGALAASYYLDIDNIDGYYNPETYAQYINESITPQHAVSIIGWDDNFSKDNFIITPPGDGVWIAKNSWGTEWGDEGILYISYYDKTFVPEGLISSNAIGIVIENTIPYNKNYQHDFTWADDFIDMNYLSGVDGSITYANQFESAGDDLIAAVGTYFNESGVNYTVEIYVNDQLKLMQEGISPFGGYHTIKLNEYIPIKTEDIFKAVITSNTMPCINCQLSRVHYTENISFFYYEGEWVDLFTDLDHVACLKVYTVSDDTKIINNNDISVDYASGKYFSVKVVTDDGHSVGAGEVVKFTINGKTTTVTTDDSGIAKIKITDVPKKYTMTTTYNGKSYKNTVTVKQVLTASKVTVKKTAKKLTLKATLKINGKLQKGKVITFKFNGKTYKVKTNAKGIAQKTLTKKVIKKLKKGKTYTVKVTYLKDTIKTTVKVK